MMKIVSLLTIFAALLFAVNAAEIKGHFVTKEGSECKWIERSYDDNIRAMFLDCICYGSTERVDYSCEYFGNPSNCELFSKPGAAERFFHHVAEHLKGQPHVCSLESFDAGRQTKICSGKSLIFTKRDAGNASEHTSAKCVNREKGKREL